MVNALLAVATALLLFATFPPLNLQFLAPVGLTPLLLGVYREREWWRRLLWGELAGMVYWGATCYWIQGVLEHYGRMGLAGSLGVFTLFCLIKGLHWAAYAALAGPLMHRSYGVPAAAALWTGLERTHAPLGFPWLALGNAGIDMDLPMRLAPLVGVYGLSFLFALIAATLAALLARKRREQIAWLLPIPALMALPHPPAPSQADREVVVLQPNIDPDQDWSGDTFQRIASRLLYRSLVAAAAPEQSPPDLLVWPEVPAPFYYFTDPRFQQALNELAKAASTPILAGTVAFTEKGEPLNSAVYISAKGEFLARYDKNLLVPFGEFVPRYFAFVNKITKEAGDFVAGRQVVTVAVAGHRLGAFICYEAAFPHFVRQFARQGAEVLLNLSNDGYFGRSAARHQHLLLARMRAAENGRWLVRATNDGITVAIDPAGRVRQMFPEYEEMAARLRFSYSKQITPYTRWGDWFAWTCLASGLFLAGSSLTWAVRRGRA